MSAVIDSLLDVKAFREDRAGTEVRKCRYALEEAVRLVEQRKRELIEYRQWRVRREIELYDAIERKPVHLHDLEELKEDIGLLRAREVHFEQNIMAAEKARAEAKQRLDAAITAYSLAMRARQKFEEISIIFEDEARLEAERREEVELEDVRRPSMDDLE